MKNSHIRFYPVLAIEKPRFTLFLQEQERWVRYWVMKQKVIDYMLRFEMVADY